MGEAGNLPRGQVCSLLLKGSKSAHFNGYQPTCTGFKLLQRASLTHAHSATRTGPDACCPAGNQTIRHQILKSYTGAQTLRTKDMLQLCNFRGTSTSGLSMCAPMNRQRGTDGWCGVEKEFIYVTKGAQEKRSRALELCQICRGGNA